MIQTQTKKQIRGLMQDPRYPALELALSEYLKDNFLEVSIKRENEFETVWSASFNEGGKYHLKAFFNNLEEMANNLE